MTSLSAGQLLHHRGWQVVLATAVVMLLIALAGTLRREPRATDAARRSDLASAG